MPPRYDQDPQEAQKQAAEQLAFNVNRWSTASGVSFNDDDMVGCLGRL